MILPLTLSDIEVAALIAEQLDPSEALDSVVHRQLVPIVSRLISQQFAELKVRYDALPLSDQVDILVQLQGIAIQRGTPLSGKPILPQGQ